MGENNSMLIYDEETKTKYKGLSAKELTDLGICPTCFDRQTGRSVFGDDSKLKFFEDADIECMFISNPRAVGHLISTPKEHYHDMADAPDKINEKIIRFTKKLMNVEKNLFGCERVYLCTMSDGPMNHYHVQLIPRYKEEERGSKNFVKPRREYVFDQEKFETIKNEMQKFAKKQKQIEENQEMER